MVIYFFSGSTIAALLLFAVALGIQAAQVFQGGVAVLSIIVFIAEAVASIHYLVKKIQYKKDLPQKTYTDIIMTAISSALLLFVSYLFLRGLNGYDAKLSDLIYFLVEFLFMGTPWLFALSGWMEASNKASFFDYGPFVKEIAASAVIVFVYLIW